MKNVIIISSSPRKDGNSEMLAKAFMAGAEEAGNVVELICLRDYNLGYCRGCYACAKTGKCFQTDGMNQLAEKLMAADIIVFATPVYFYSMSGQLKVFTDRLLPVYTKIHADIYLMCTATDTDERLLEMAIESMRGCTRYCMENCREKGVIMVGGVTDRGDIQGREELMKAHKMGINC